jgi:putative aldouronate transport system substrate-binding protein
MLKAKKCIIAVLSAAMVMSAFAGCGKKNDSTNNTGNTKVTDTTGDPAKEEGPKPTLKALVVYKSGLDYNNYPVQKYLEEKTGYKVEYDTLPQDKPMDKLNMIIASGQEYDFITIYNDRNTLGTYAEQGALVDLEPLVQQYGPNIVKNIDSKMFDNIRIDGKYYAIPSTSPSGRTDSTNVGAGVLVRQDWLDKLGLKAPTTVDEFTNMLQQFKDKDPNGNGAQNIALTLDQSLNLIDNGLGGAFGVGTSWIDVNGSLEPRTLMPGFKDYILYLKDLYSKGLIDKESPTNQGSTAKEKFTSGRAGAMIAAYYDIPTISDTMKKTQPDAKLAYIPPVSGPGGKAVEPAGDLNNAIDCFTMIPKSSKHPEDVIKYFNAKLEESTFKELVIGIEGVHHTVKDGGYYPILPIFFDERGSANQYLTGASKDYGKYWLARVRKDDRLYTAWKQLNLDFGDAVVVDPISKAPTIKSLAKNKGVLNKLQEDFLIKSVVSDFSDKAFEEFAAQWKSQGGEEVIKEVNEWYKTTK